MDADSSLVERLRAREPGALEDAYREHGLRVYRLSLRILGRKPDAEDATQEVFLKLMQHAASYSGLSRFSTWLHRMTVNHCLHRLERERLRETAPLPEEHALGAALDDGPTERLARNEARESLQRLLDRLTVDHRVVLVLREIEELSYQEIAETLSIPVGTVMSRLARAREQLVRLARPKYLPETDTIRSRL